jgi:hypothetical protein
MILLGRKRADRSVNKEDTRESGPAATPGVAGRFLGNIFLLRNPAGGILGRADEIERTREALLQERGRRVVQRPAKGRDT